MRSMGRPIMKHKIVWTKAVGSKVAYFDITQHRVWPILLGSISALVALMVRIKTDPTVVKNIAELTDYGSLWMVVVISCITAPATIFCFLTRPFPCSHDRLEKASEDSALPRWVRDYAFAQLRDNALARGADGWASIWEERRAGL